MVGIGRIPDPASKKNDAHKGLGGLVMVGLKFACIIDKADKAEKAQPFSFPKIAFAKRERP